MIFKQLSEFLTALNDWCDEHEDYFPWHYYVYLYLKLSLLIQSEGDSM